MKLKLEDFSNFGGTLAINELLLKLFYEFKIMNVTEF